MCSFEITLVSNVLASLIQARPIVWLILSSVSSIRRNIRITGSIAADPLDIFTSDLRRYSRSPATRLVVAYAPTVVADDVWVIGRPVLPSRLDEIGVSRPISQRSLVGRLVISRLRLESSHLLELSLDFFHLLPGRFLLLLNLLFFLTNVFFLLTDLFLFLAGFIFFLPSLVFPPPSILLSSSEGEFQPPRCPAINFLPPFPQVLPFISVLALLPVTITVVIAGVCV